MKYLSVRQVVGLIFDNLRRSLVPPSLLALLAGGWLFGPGPAWFWILLVAGVLFFVSSLGSAWPESWLGGVGSVLTPLINALIMQPHLLNVKLLNDSRET